MDSTAPIPRLRADRYDLAAPVVLDTGARRVEAVIARVGVLPYPWGREYVPASTLSDPAWLSSLAGVPLLYARDGHPDRPWTIEDSAGAERVGVVLSARYDAASEAVVAEVVVDTAEGVELLARGVRGVSPWYTAETDAAPGVTPGGEVYDLTQTRRTAANHVVLTSSPRGGPGVEVRADATGSSMDEEMKIEGEGAPAPEIEVELEAETPEAPPAPEGAAAALVASLLEALAPQHAAMMERMDGMMKRIDAMYPAAPAEGDAMRADSRAVRLAWREVETAARVVGVELPDDLTLTAARRKVATGLGVERADALTGPELSATLRAARVVLSSPRRDAWSRVAADTRADARPPVPSLDHQI
jgi:hypothetical protein